MPNLIFHPQNHTYTLDGVIIPGVTEIIGRRYPYRCNHGGESETCPQCIYLRDLGTAVHAATAYHDRGTLDVSTVDPVIMGHVNQWRRFVASINPDVIAIEGAVHYKSFFAGTLDRIWCIKKRFTLIDIKTGAKMKSHILQTAAYAGAWGEMFPKQKINECWAVYLDGSEKSASIVVYKSPSDFQAFLSLLNFTMWELKNNIN
jgi:hypothetical protein